MTDNIVPFSKPRPTSDRIWTCAHCGCQTFYLYEDGRTECALCNFIDTESGGWVEHLDEKPDFDPRMDTRTTVGHGSAQFAQQSIKKTIGEQTVALVVVQDDGRIQMWSGVDNHSTPEQQDWLKRSLDIAKTLALGETTTDPITAFPK